MVNVTRYDPFSELVNDLFRGFVVRPVGDPLARVKLDVAESNGSYTVNADLPGVRKEDIQVSIDGAEVTLTAEAKREKEASKDERVLHTERVYGKVSRSFTLPQEIDEAKAEAKFRDGVLELKLPKKVAAARKQVTIQ
jgi:HSP20 family protein